MNTELENLECCVSNYGVTNFEVDFEVGHEFVVSVVVVVSNGYGDYRFVLEPEDFMVAMESIFGGAEL